jgi:antitoxin component of RelBE/YafQ-DinJ toxin-antitoxin module
MTLANTGDIPLGLTMPNKDKLSALHERRFDQSLLTLIAELKKSTANDSLRHV